MSKFMHQKIGNKMTFEMLASQWLQSVSHGIKESTQAHYRYTLTRYILPVLASIRCKRWMRRRWSREFYKLFLHRMAGICR